MISNSIQGLNKDLYGEHRTQKILSICGKMHLSNDIQLYVLYRKKK